MNTLKISNPINCYLLLAIILLSFCNTSLAQTIEVIEVDTITGEPKKQLPFDRPFILKVKVDSKPSFIEFMKLEKGKPWYRVIKEQQKDTAKLKRIRKKEVNRKIKEYSKRETLFYYDSLDFENLQKEASSGRYEYSITPFSRVPNNNIQYIKGEKENFVYIKFGYLSNKPKPLKIGGNQLLNPKENISVLISSPDGLKVYRWLHEKDRKKVIEYIEKQIKLSEIEFDSVMWSLPTIDDMDDFYANRLTNEFDSIDFYNKKIISNRANFLEDFNGSGYLSDLLKVAFSQSCECKNSDKIDCFEVCKLKKVSQSLFTIDKDKSEAVLSGQLTLENPYLKKSISLAKRSANLKITQKHIQELIRFSDIHMMQGGLSFDDSKRSALADALAILSTNSSYLSKVIKFEELISGRIEEIGHFDIVKSVGGNTNIYDFQARAKLQINPDFGYVGYGLTQEGFRSFTPYLGFHVNLRAIDKNIPFDHYPNKTWKHRLSIMTGWTLTKIAEEGKREDFFDESSLLMGVGFRVCHAVKIIGGGMFFYQNDPNPIITNRSLAVTPYVGVSIDLDIKQFLNDFTSLKPSN